MSATLADQPHLLNSPTFEPQLQAWQAAKIQPVAPAGPRHSIHSYFNSCPESPDGKRVLYFTSTTRSGESGEICILDRATGAERILVSGVTTEDAHRVACQQWVANGRKIVFHDFRQGHWLVASVDPETGKEQILAMDRQIGFGTPGSVWVPIYGCHWKPGAHRDLELVNAETGEIRTALTIGEVLKRYGSEVVKLVGQGETSIFFPVMSPDGNKVFFKIARGSGTDDFRSSHASERQGKFVYDLSRQQFIRYFTEWGHPSWSPDSQGIFEKGNILTDLASGHSHRYAPASPSDHPSLSPDQKLFVTDKDITYWETGHQGEWAIIVGSTETDEYATIHRFDHTNGATSWRKPHPHPVFSADGRRIYFNVSHDGWTKLYVAELAKR